MIRFTRRGEIRVKPRFRLLGLLRDWQPFAANTKWSGAEPFPTAATPETLQAHIANVQVTHTPTLDFERGPVKSYSLGSFDFEPRANDLSATPRGHILGVRATSPPDCEKHRETAKKTQILTAILQPPLDILLDPRQVLEWPAPLLPYQKDGVRALLERTALLLADDMGLGKTVQVIAALRILIFRYAIQNALIVCPTSLLRQWISEFRKWAPELRVVAVNETADRRAALWRISAHVHLVSYDTLRRDVLDIVDSPVLRGHWDVLVLDEASRIKNRETGLSLAAKRIPSARRWAITGTPLENRIEDVASILDFLLADPSSGRRHLVSGAEARTLLPDYQLRRRKLDVLKDLPPKQVIELFVELTPKQRASYDFAEREGVVALSAMGDTVTVENVLTLITRLKQICNADPQSGESSKLTDIRERLEIIAAEGHRALVFTQFTNSKYGVQRVVEELKDFHPLTFTGDLSQRSRSNAVETFSLDDRHKALILSLRAGGVGLNLQVASYVFHLDRWWNPATEDQAESRAHRMGQQNPVTVYRYICVNTIEDRIHQKLEEKRALFREVVDDVSIGLSQVLSAEDLFGLFNLAVPKKGSHQGIASDRPNFNQMPGEEFEHWLRSQLQRLGYQASLTPRSRDGGVDIIASRLDEIGIESKLLIQCKSTTGPTGVRVIRELRGVTQERCSGATPIVACPAGFTDDARQFAEQNGVRLWEARDLVDLWVAAQNNSGTGVAETTSSSNTGESA